MIEVHWWWIPLLPVIGALLGLVLAYAFRGFWRRLIAKVKAPLLTELADIKTHLTTIYESAETAGEDAAAKLAKLKAEIGKVVAKVEKAAGK